MKLTSFYVRKSKKVPVHLNQFINPIAFCTSLTDLDLSYNSYLNNGDVGDIAYHCRNLTRLNLASCPFVTKKGMKWLSNFSHRILFADLAFCENIPSKGIRYLASSSENLHSLSLEHCSRLKNKAIRSLAMYCTNLRALNLTFCKKLTPHVVKSLQKLTNLTKLNVEENTWVDDTFVIKLTTSLSQLNYFNLNKCPKITDLSLEVIGNFKTLRELHIKGLSKITEEGLKKIGDCQNLTYLDISTTPFTKDGLEYLIKRCTHLMAINISFIEYASLMGDNDFRKRHAGLITFHGPSSA